MTIVWTTLAVVDFTLSNPSQVNYDSMHIQIISRQAVCDRREKKLSSHTNEAHGLFGDSKFKNFQRTNTKM